MGAVQVHALRNVVYAWLGMGAVAGAYRMMAKRIRKATVPAAGFRTGMVHVGGFSPCTRMRDRSRCAPMPSQAAALSAPEIFQFVPWSAWRITFLSTAASLPVPCPDSAPASSK